MKRTTPVAALALLVASQAPAGTLVVGAGTTFDLGSGSVDLGCADLDVSGTYAAGTGSTSRIRHLDIATSGVVEGEQGVLEVTGNWDNLGTLNAGTGSVRFVDGCGTSSASILGNNTFSTLEFESTSGKTFSLAAGSTQTVNGSLVMLGDTGASLALRSTQSGSEAFLDVQGSHAISQVDVEDNHAIGMTLFVDDGSLLGSNTSGWEFMAGVPVLPGLDGERKGSRARQLQLARPRV
jgi:hypothetical protein